jgi:hypothetical protein
MKLSEQETDLIYLDQLEFSTCGGCGHSDLDINMTCWHTGGRFGEDIDRETEICQYMYDQLVIQGRYDLNA